MITISITEERYMELLEYEKECLHRRNSATKSKGKDGSDTKALVIEAIKKAMIIDNFVSISKFDMATARDEFKILRKASDGANNLAFARAIESLKQNGTVVVGLSKKVFTFVPSE